MGKHILFQGGNGYMKFGGVEVTSYCESVEVNMSQADEPTTSVASRGVERIAGLRDDNFSITVEQDENGAASLGQVLYNLFTGGTAFVVECAEGGTAISNTNPKYSGTVIMTEYNPITGSAGEVVKPSLTFPVSGVITRATA